MIEWRQKLGLLDVTARVLTSDIVALNLSPLQVEQQELLVYLSFLEYFNIIVTARQA